jgi:DNA-binding GntR family transcriptional regulator
MQKMSPVLRDQVCNALRSSIIEGRLPPSTLLREERLAAELQVSRTPLREAIRQLAEEGFVEQAPRRGARVASLTPDMVREVYEVREALEGMAARLAAQRIDDSRVARLKERLENLRPRIAAGDFSDTGDLVHEEIFAACGNSRLRRLMAVYRGKVAWIQRTAFRMSERLDLAYQEHESIVRALECRDSEWAEAAVRRHIRNTLAELMDLLRPSSGRNGEGETK